MFRDKMVHPLFKVIFHEKKMHVRNERRYMICLSNMEEIKEKKRKINAD